jgi:hypothetical protein
VANVQALLALADGLATHLSRAYPKAMNDVDPVKFEAVCSATVHKEPPDNSTRLTIWPYRASINEHQRNRSFALPQGLTNRPLPLDVHLLVSVWATRTEHELTLFTWAMRELYQLSAVDGSVLSTVDAEMRPDEQLQLSFSDLSLEDMMRLWEGNKGGYRLSFALLARVLQVDITQRDAEPVVARRLRLQDQVPSQGLVEGAA